MNLSHHAKLLWRFRALTAVGIGLAICFGVLAAYQVTWEGKPTFEARGTETWQSESSLLVTQPGFPEGRVTLPEVGVNGPVTGAADANPSGQVVRRQPGAAGAVGAKGRGQIEFAAPERFSELATLYVELANSDEVRKQVPGAVKPAQILAEQVEGPASRQLPVMRLTTLASQAAAAQKLNREVVSALQRTISGGQTINEVPVARRVKLSVIKASSPPTLKAGRTHTSSIIAVLLTLIGTVALVHLLAALRGSPRSGKTDGAADDQLFAWDAERAMPRVDLHERSEATSSGPPEPVGRISSP